MLNGRPIIAELDLDALRHNVDVVRSFSKSAKVFGVVKANAYGHGLANILPALSNLDGLAVVEMEAAELIRERDEACRILLLQGVFEEADLEDALRLNLDLVVHTEEQVCYLERCFRDQQLNIFLKINTGMNRLGFSPGEALSVYHRLLRCDSVAEITVMTHYADADNARGTGWQDAILAETFGDMDVKTSLSNSAALINKRSISESWVRPGIMLYGASPTVDVDASSLNLRPVMTLKTQVIGVQNISRGERVGYGGTFEAKFDMRVGILSGGYGDGYPRSAPSGTPVIVGGKKTSTLGRVSMDSVAVDLTHLPAAQIGSEVVLWGRGLPVEIVADHSGTISYELLTRICGRVPFVIEGDADSTRLQR